MHALGRGWEVKGVTEKLSCGKSNNPPNQERTPSKKDIKDMKTARLTTMVTARLTAEVAPLDAASITLVLVSLKRQVQRFEGHTLPILSCVAVLMKTISHTFVLMSCSSLTWEVSVSGQKVLATARDAGAVMTVAVSTYFAFTYKETTGCLFLSQAKVVTFIQTTEHPAPHPEGDIRCEHGAGDASQAHCHQRVDLRER